ncbi:glycosyltransferase family 9 protein [Couchioplanes caeruleus]|uniref:Glycosyl transferase n=2 Tax=Couchioplanes caeruleus TaxID=56438 RepID=A0A1K0FB29_9ACTN|nr:glycosyltransferase family 9 protein [Couchioplanes caeruleus]OJF10061.1 glycosyl transferase [Couchioplanes caeruleus subsp. caeruleus]ROP27670.1 ADP-heptose:LPS heptosyltransferase [Couchioplanes caeruleus]
MILVLRALGVGDLAAGVPALRALRSAFPARTLALAAPAWLTPLIELVGGVDRIVPADGLGAPLPALPPVEVAVNLHGRGPRSHRLLQAVEPAKLWAFASPEAGHLDGPAWIEEDHEVHRWCRLPRHYGAAADPSDLMLAVPAVDVPHDVTIVHPGAKSPSRRWPPERFAAVARALAAAGHRVLVTGTDAEREIVRRVATRAGLGPDSVVRTGLDELAGLVAHARLLVSGDTGIAHLASAYRTPSVVLFGPMPPRRWGPPPRPYHRAIWHGTRAERGDQPGPDVHPALLAVTVEEVLEAARDVERHAVKA